MSIVKIRKINVKEVNHAVAAANNSYISNIQNKF